MLVLSRKVDERIQIGDNIVVTVVRIADGAVRLGIDAPVEMAIVRREIKPRDVNRPEERPAPAPR